MSTNLNDCGCCEGITAIIPRSLANRPGLAHVNYRVGTHREFLESSLAALSRPEFAPLRSLTTREHDDLTIALLNGWATLADVLTFYQERLAHELWLRTATERDSVLRLAQLIGYRLNAGVAAQTPLSFLLDETPGAPTEVLLATGAKVQSVPGQDEAPQMFETIEPLNARVEWNALTLTLTTPAVIEPGLTSLYLKGTATQLQPGDAILIVGDERDQSGVNYPDKERWDFRVLLTVAPDVKNARTHITWAKGLGESPILPAAANPRVYGFRQRAALFGHNAPDPNFVTKPGGGPVGNWPNFELTGPHIDLDSAYAKIVAGSWVALVNSTGYVELYKATAVSFPSRADFALSGKVTRVLPDTTEHFHLFGFRDTIVYAQSEPLELTSGPLLTPATDDLSGSLERATDLLAPVEGSVIRLARHIPSLPPGRAIIVTGNPLRARVTTPSLTLVAPDGQQTLTVKRGASLVLLGRPTLLHDLRARYSLRTDDGFHGTVITSRSALVLTAAREDDASISETATVRECSGNPTVLTLEAALSQLYDRATVTLVANVALATHGETVTEVLGNGDAAQTDQRFVLKQAPLTYVRSTASGGSASSLQIRVDDLLWHETPSLFGRGPDERIYTTTIGGDGSVTVRFGDGVHGARLPSGTQNVKATYRRGTGLAGHVRAGQLSTLLTRPPGLKAAINPLPAEGADEPERLADARQNAPLTVLTLDRVVSLEDYENFSRAYPGIAKALATWTWDGRTRGIFLTVAAPEGRAVSIALADELVAAILQAGDPFVPVRIASFRAAYFRIAARIVVHRDFETAKVLDAVRAAWQTAFAFAPRQFGQSVMLSEVIALAQAVAGVVAVNVTRLHRRSAAPTLNSRLEAELPAGSDPAELAAAELLMLDAASLEREAVS